MLRHGDDSVQNTTPQVNASWIYSVFHLRRAPFDRKAGSQLAWLIEDGNCDRQINKFHQVFAYLIFRISYNRLKGIGNFNSSISETIHDWRLKEIYP